MKTACPMFTGRLLLVALFQLSPGIDAAAEQSEGEPDGRRGGTVTVDSSPRRLITMVPENYYPYFYVDNFRAPAGFGVDLLLAVVKAAGMQVEIRVDTMERAREALRRGQIDFVPMMTYSAERDSEFDYSDARALVHDAIFSLEGADPPPSIRGLGNRRIVVMRDGVAHDYLKSRLALPRVRVVTAETYPQSMRILAAGEADAALMPRLVGLLLVREMNCPLISTSPVDVEEYVRTLFFAVQAGNDDLLFRLDSGMDLVHSSGLYRRIHAKWFAGVEPRDVVARASLKAVAVLLVFALGMTVWVLMLRRQVAARTAHLVREIEQRIRVEKELRRNREESACLADLLEFSSQPMGTVYPDGRLGRVNGAFERLVGYSALELASLDRSRELTPPEWRDGEREHLEKLEATGDPVRYEKEYLRKDGTRVPVELFVHLVRGGGGAPAYYYAFMTEISERKAARVRLEEKVAERTRELGEANRRLQELDRLKGLFIASVSHELRTPLNAIIGFTGIILQGMAGDINEEQRRQLGMVKRSADHLLALVNDVIDVNRIEAGQIVPGAAPFDLTEAAGEIRNEFLPQALQKGLRIELDAPGPLVIRGDARRTRQVIMNLVGNAVKYTDAGSVRIACRRRGADIVVEVNDSGRGIPDERLGDLFQPFTRIGRQEGAGKMGTGLGLYLSQKIATLLGGTITVASTPGRGSTFTFRLPCGDERR